MSLLLIAMILALLIPIYEACKNEHIWQKMLALSSICSKSAVLILMASVLRDDWMIGIVGVMILSVGNAGLMLLANVLKRMSDI